MGVVGARQAVRMGRHVGAGAEKEAPPLIATAAHAPTPQISPSPGTMQFLGSEAERQFRLHFHRQRVPQDRVFACTQVGRVLGAPAGGAGLRAFPSRLLRTLAPSSSSRSVPELSSPQPLPAVRPCLAQWALAAVPSLAPPACGCAHMLAAWASCRASCLHTPAPLPVTAPCAAPCAAPSPYPPQVAIVALLLLRDAGPLPPALRLLYWGTCASSAAVLALSVFARHRYATLRPYLLVTTRVVYDLLCPQLVWHLASQNMARNADRGSWPSEWMDCR